MEKILGAVRRAVDDYGMISEGDRIAVGVSGGKDSVMLLAALHRLSLFYPKKFSVVGLTLDMGIPQMDFTPLRDYAHANGIEWHIRPTRINEIIFEKRREAHPCSLCARLRRGALNRFAVENGIHKIALGHHFDDVIETFLLNLIYEGRLGCFSPVTYLDRMDVTVLRPLIYLPETKIKACVQRERLPVVANPCPANGNTQRSEMKTLIAALGERYKDLPVQIFGAIQRSGIDGWKESGRGKKI